MTFVTHEMELALTRLQTVEPFDFDAAYGAAYTGIHGLDPRRNEHAAELIYGRSLALQLWARRQSATLAARSAEATV